MAKDPTAPVPLKERATARSTIGSGGIISAVLLDVANVFGGTAGFDLEHLGGLICAVALTAVGYAKDVAVEIVKVRAEAAGVNFEDAQEQSKQVGKVMRRFVPAPDELADDLAERAGDL